MADVFLLAVRCRAEDCGVVFDVCRSCYRGQAYCGDRCREKGRRQIHREANRGYQRTPWGRDDHRDRQRDYRERRRQQAGVTDLSCADPPVVPTVTPAVGTAVSGVVDAGWKRDQLERGLGGMPPRCIVCGRPGIIVARMP